MARSTRHDSNNSACFRVDDRPWKGLYARAAIDIRQRSLAAILDYSLRLSAAPTATCDDVQEQIAVLQAQIDELLSQPCGGDDACDVELYAVEGEDVYDSMGVRRDCCPGLEPTLEDRDPSDPLIGTWPQIIVCREPSARRNLRGEAKA